jgi:hypothetical protein
MFRFFLIVGILLNILSPAEGRVLDGATSTHPVIKDIVDYLDAKGIDVRNGAEAFDPVSNRPQVTDLRNFPIDAALAGSDDPFTPSFNAGVETERAYLVAVKSVGTPQPKSLQDFVSVWDASQRSNRVFLSFSGKDLKLAQTVADSLRAKNYVVFLFKNDEAGLPNVNPVETGRFFKQASHHLVIDTSNARASAAVNAEALSLRLDDRPKLPRPIYPRPNPSAASQGGTTCCQLCEYVNGVLMGCEPPVCDNLVCANARPSPSGKLENLFKRKSLQFDLGR